MYKRNKKNNKLVIGIIIISLFVLLTISLLAQSNGSKHNILKNYLSITYMALSPGTHNGC